jgi:ureidoglycolate lyase
MSIMKIKLRALTREDFNPFGDVIDTYYNKHIITINNGLAHRHHDLTNVDVSENNGKAIISIIDTKPTKLPLQVSIMERHPIGSQAFMPIGNSPYIVLVAPKGDFDAKKLCGFLAQPNQGVNYAKGTWHHACISLHQSNQFFVVDRGGEGPNCDFFVIPEEHNIVIESEQVV